MNKWIRWQGLVLFASIVGLIALFWFVFADMIVRLAIEKTGTKLAGAKVELQKADLSLMPVGLRLEGLKVTNPDKPMENLFELETISFGLDGPRLFKRQVIVNEMTVTGLRLNTPRKSSGAIRPEETLAGASKKAAKSAAEKALCSEGGFSVPSFSVPDVKEILSKESLESLARLESMKKDMEDERRKWQERLKALPDKQAFDEYKSRMEKLKASSKGGLGGMVGSAAEVQSLKRDIEQDVGKIRDARMEFEKALTDARERMKEARAAPIAEARRLAGKYTLTPSGLKKMTRQLFGLRLCESVENALAWYRRVQPLLERSEVKTGGGSKDSPRAVKPLRAPGVDVRFKEENPTPDFLIRKILASADLESGNLKGRVENLTPDQNILGKPLTVDFKGENLAMLKSVTFDGRFDHIHPVKSSDHVEVDLRGYRLTGQKLSTDERFPVTLAAAIVDMDMDAGISEGLLDGVLTARFGSVEMEVPKVSGQGPVAKALASAISGVKSIDMKAGFSGPPANPEISVSSNLDKVVHDAVASAVKGQAAQFEEKLRGAITERVKGPLGELDKNMDGLAGISAQLKDRLDLGSNTLAEATKGLSGGLKLPF